MTAVCQGGCGGTIIGTVSGSLAPFSPGESMLVSSSQREFSTNPRTVSLFLGAWLLKMFALLLLTARRQGQAHLCIMAADQWGNRHTNVEFKCIVKVLK